jgi:hypothetical protein
MRPASVTGIFLLASTFALAGCGGSSPMIETPPTKPVAPATSSLRGQVFGGQQPVTGMTLQLYDAGSTGYGSAATGLLATPPLTDSNGNFSFANPTCPNGSDQLYLVGTGGDPVAGNSTYGNSNANANLALMLAVGSCSGLSSLPSLHMNELTTVAAVWALAPFMSGATPAFQNVGTSPGNALGLQLAFEAAQEVASISTGTFPGTLPANGTLPTDELNTIADILEACINSKGGTANDGTTPCGSLFGLAPSGSGVYPTDVITAAMNIAQNPAHNVTPLFQLASPTGAFQSELGSAPAAWTVAINYTEGGLKAPTAIATDQSGNVWVTNSGTPSVSQFANSGAPNASFGANGLTLAGTPGGIAIDLTGNAWITIPANDSVVEVNSSGGLGTTISGTPAGLNDPTSIAIDGGGNIWVVNSGSGANSVSGFSTSGSPLANSPFTGGGISSPVAIAINGNANANCSDCH